MYQRITFFYSKHYLHLLMPTLEELANQGSIMNTHRNVAASSRPSLNAGLSWRRSPFLNQCTMCFPEEHRAVGGFTVGVAGAVTGDACVCALGAGSVSAAADIFT